MPRDSSRELSNGKRDADCHSNRAITAICELEQLRGQVIEQDEAAVLVEEQAFFFHVRDKAADHGS